MKRLRFVANFNPSKSEIASLDRQTVVTFLPMEAIGDDGTLKLETEKTIGEVESGYTYFRDGDVTVAKITPCYENGKGSLMLGLVNGIGFGTTELIVARPKPKEISGNYLHYLFISPDFRSIGESHMYGAGGQKRVPDAFVRNFATAFPPLHEQTTIATFLDQETTKIDTLITEQKRLIELLKEKRQAVISHAVTKGLNPDVPMKDSGVAWLGEVPEGWEVKPLKYVGAIVSGYAFSSSDFTSSGIRVLKIANIQTFKIDWSDDSYLPNEFFNQYPKFVVKNDDVVFALTRPLISTGLKAAVVNIGSDQVLLNQRNALFRAFEGFSKLFIYQVLFSSSFLVAFENKIDFTGQQPNISPIDIGDIKVPVPPLAEQVFIAGYLESLATDYDTLTTEAHRAIALLQERRTALISAAVTGQIDVRQFIQKEPS